MNFGEIDKEKMETIALLLMAFPNWNHNKSKSEIAMATRSYYLALSDVGNELLVETIQFAIRTNKFLPTPSELREIIINELLKRKPSIDIISIEINKTALMDNFKSKYKDVSILSKERAIELVTSQIKRREYLEAYLDCENELGGIYEEWRKVAGKNQGRTD